MQTSGKFVADATPRHKNFIDLTGQKFGRITVTHFIGRVKYKCGASAPKWGGRCACGTTGEWLGNSLKMGTTQSCGCFHRDRASENATHGYTRNGKKCPEYRAWVHMLTRCNNSKIWNFKNYGGRGIKVCDRWRKSFENFLEDMGPRPSPEHSLDRIDNNADYSKSNCKWSTKAEQSRNRRSTVFLTFKGRTLCLKEWSKEIGVNRHTLRRRLNSGWSIERTLTEPSFTRITK